MAGRRFKNNAEYFPHIVKYGKTMRYIEKKYGNDGYAVWFKVLEELTKAEYHYIDMKDVDILNDLADFCNLDDVKLLEIVEEIAKRNNFNRELWFDYQILWSDRLIESLQKLYERRANDCITRGGLYKLLGINKKQKKTDSPKLPIEEPPKNVLYEKELEILLGHFPEKLLPKTDKQKSNWLDCVRLLIETDGYSFTEVEKIVAWARDSDFWKSNFLSLLKLRNKNKEGIKYVDVFNEQIKSVKSNNSKTATQVVKKEQELKLEKQDFSKKFDANKLPKDSIIKKMLDMKLPKTRTGGIKRIGDINK